MTGNESKVEYPFDPEEMKYWARRGTKTAAFLLVSRGAQSPLWESECF